MTKPVTQFISSPPLEVTGPMGGTFDLYRGLSSDPVPRLTIIMEMNDTVNSVTLENLTNEDLIWIRDRCNNLLAHEDAEEAPPTLVEALDEAVDRDEEDDETNIIVAAYIFEVKPVAWMMWSENLARQWAEATMRNDAEALSALEDRVDASRSTYQVVSSYADSDEVRQGNHWTLVVH